MAEPFISEILIPINYIINILHIFIIVTYLWEYACWKCLCEKAIIVYMFIMFIWKITAKNSVFS